IWLGKYLYENNESYFFDVNNAKDIYLRCRFLRRNSFEKALPLINKMANGISEIILSEKPDIILAPIIDNYTLDILERISKNEQPDEAKQFINQLYAGIISGFVEDNVAESLEETEEHYTKSISELSKLDPITAYQLNGKNKIFQVFDLLHDYYDKVKETLPNEPGLNEQIKLTIETIKPEIIKDAISDLEDKIRDIALSINLWTLYRARRAVNNTKTKIRKDDEKKIDELLNMVMPKMT
ncbi:MAG TPA: hypothetical protein PK448_01000, partial [Bacteroidales bacterium]|nr:hypothetical protein [Bacteroidales bacterium]